MLKANGSKIQIPVQLETCRDLVIEKTEKWILENSINNSKSPSCLYVPATDYTMRGGKWIRPLLTYVTALALGYRPPAYEGKKYSFESHLKSDHEIGLEHVLAANQYKHNFLVSIDEIQDSQLLRSNELSLHGKIGIPQALDVSLLFMNESFGTLAQPLIKLRQQGNMYTDGFKEKESALLKKFFDEVLEVYNSYTKTVEGQSLEVEYRDHKNLDELTPDVPKRIDELKTGWYTGGSPMALGAIEAGASKYLVDLLREAGIGAATGFQLADDNNDIKAILKFALNKDMEHLRKWGKGLGDDFKEGKRTLPVAYYVEKKKGTEEYLKFRGNLGRKGLDMETMVEMANNLQDSGVLQETDRLAEQLVREAKEKVMKHVEPTSHLNLLLHLFDYMIKRDI